VSENSQPILMIDPGHGGTDPGASGHGLIEKNMVLDISLYQYNRFKELGVSVGLTRNNDTFIDGTSRANIVVSSKAKYCISNHINAASSSTAKGAEIIHSIHDDGLFAKVIANSLADAGQVLRPTATYCKSNAQGKDYYFMHRQTGNVKTCIVEYGFLTNKEDANRLQMNWIPYAEAVVQAFCQFVGHDYSEPLIKTDENVANKSGFEDVPNHHWAAASITKAVESNIFTGVSKERFYPDRNVTRAQLAVILDRAGLLK